MKIIELNYQENKELTLEGLEKYFNNKLSQAEQDAFSDTTEEDPMMRPTGTYSFALKKEEEIIGRIFGELDYFNSCVRINGLIIEQDARGTGAGSILMKTVEELGRREGCHVSFVNTTLSSAPKFYEKQGYKCIEMISDYPVISDTYYYFYKKLF